MSDQQTLVLLSGGMDTQSPNIAAPKGSLRDCLNYEVGTQAGYSRIRGWQPHDGTIMGPGVEDFIYVMVPFADWSGVPFEYAEQVELGIVSGEFVGTQQAFANCIGWSNPSPGIDGVLILSFTPGLLSTAFYLAYSFLSDASGGASGAGITFTVPGQLLAASTGLLTPQRYTAYRGNIQTLHAAAITPVPGEPNSSVDGVFTYKDRDYAIHDCLAFYFKAGSDGTVTEGHIIKDGSTQIGIVLSIVVTSGSWVAGTAAGYIVIYDQPAGVSFPADGTTLNYWSADGTTDLGPAFQYDGVTDRLTLLSKTRALLYGADPQLPGETKADTPWLRRRLSREIGYTQIGATGSIGFGPQGDNDYSIYEYSRLGLNQQNQQLAPVTTAYKFCATVAQNATAWVNLANIQAQDGAVATCIIGGHTTIMKATNFDFSEIPRGSVITGLEVVIRRRATTSATSTRDNIVRLVLPDGTFSPNKADQATRYPLVLTDATYGSATDTWGVQLSRDMLNDPLFGVHFEAFKFSADTTSVDDIKLRVTYVPATRLVYIRDAAAAAPSDIEARVVHYTVDTGSSTASTPDSAGILTLWIGEDEWDGTAAGKSRRIGIGEEIRTASGGGGSLLAKTTGEDVPTSLPCGAAVDAKSALWEFKLANFYADPDAQMVFMANGTEYCVMYDEQYSVRIRTGRRQDLDTPRHIHPHLGFMHFGFDSGDVITSATFRPLTVDPAGGSQIRNVGEPVMGLETWSGQTLGVWTNRAVRGYQGNSPSNYIPVVISPAIGCIEYTATVLAGTPMWTSMRGVESAATVSAYGDFQTNPLTLNVQSWIQGRVQFDSRVGLIDKRPVMAVASQSDRQYQLYFRDGYRLTVTLFGAEDIPMCTVQRLERGTAEPPYRSAPVRHVFAGIRDDGHEVMLCAFARQNPIITLNAPNNGAYAKVAMLNVGYSFAGENIPAYIELNPIYASIPSQDQQWQYLQTWVSGHPLMVITVTSMQAQDIPFVSGANPIPAQLQAGATATYLPFPNYEISYSVGRYGPFVRLRYDTSELPSEPHRFTHLTLTNNPQMTHRG